MKSSIPADTPPLTFGHTAVGSPVYDQGLFVNGGSASALEGGGVSGILRSDASPFVYEWGVAGQASSHVTRYDPASQRRRETVIIGNHIPVLAAINQSSNRMYLTQEDRTAIVEVDLDTMLETRRKYLAQPPGTAQRRFADAESGSIWLVRLVEGALSLVEIRMNTLDYGRMLDAPAELTGIGAIIPGPAGTHYILGTGNPRGVFAFDSVAGAFEDKGIVDLGATIARGLYIAPLNQIAVATSGAGPRIYTFDADTFEQVLDVPTPVAFTRGLYYREQDHLLYGVNNSIPPTLVALDPASGDVVASKLTGYDLVNMIGFLQEVVFDPVSDIVTFVSNRRAIGSFPGGSLDVTPARPIREGVREILADPARNRIWMIGTASTFVDWIEYYDAETLEVLGSIERPTASATMVSQRVDESSGDLQLEVRTDPRTVIHVNRESMAIEVRANLEYAATSTSTQAILAVASTGDLYAYVPTSPARLLRFPVGSGTHDANYAFPVDASVSFLGHDDALNLVFGLGADSEGQKIFHFAPTDLSLLDALALDGTVTTSSSRKILYHRQRQEIVVWGGFTCSAVPIENPEVRVIRIAPSEALYFPRMVEYDAVTGEIHVVFSHGSTVEWHTLDAGSGRLRAHGVSYGEGFFFPQVIRHGPEPLAVANISGILKRLERNNPSLRPFDQPPSRILALGQSFGPVGDSQVLLSREHGETHSFARRLLSPSFIETTDWRTRQVLDRPLGIITGKTADMVGLPTSPPSIAMVANAQFVEVSILDSVTMEELNWTGLDPDYGEAAWMAHDPVGGHLVIGTVLVDGGGFLLTLNADTLAVVDEHEFAPEDGKPVVGVVDPTTSDIIVGLDGTDPAVARFTVPALDPLGLIMLDGLGLPCRGGAAVDGEGRRAYFVLRTQGRRVAIDLETFGIHSSALSSTHLPPIRGTSTYEMTLNLESGLGYVVGAGWSGLQGGYTVSVQEFSLADCQQTRTVVAMDPMSYFGLGHRPFALAYDHEKDLVVLGGGYFMHTTFRDLINKVRIQFASKIRAERMQFYSHAADGDLKFGIYRNTGSAFRERLWESGTIANTTEEDFLTVPIELEGGEPLILEPGMYFITWRTNSHESVGSFTSWAVPGGVSLPLPFELDSPMLPNRNLNAFPIPWSIAGGWTFYLEATPVVDPLSGWAIY